MIYFRSQRNGNCLFSSVSLLIYGNNDLVEELHVLSCIELYKNSELYAKHTAFSNNDNQFQCVNNIIQLCLSEDVSRQVMEEGLEIVDAIKLEAIHCCQDKRFVGNI